MSATPKSLIREWLREAPEGATHMLVVCDQFDHDDFPEYWPDPARPELAGKTLREHVDELDGRELTMVHEVYDLRLDHFSQLDEVRARHIDDDKEPSDA